VRQDKLREVKAGHDGTWVAHPGLVPVAKEIFDKYMPEPNQISRKTRIDAAASGTVQAQDLLAVPQGDITEAGLRWNIDVGCNICIRGWAGIGLRSDLQPDGRRRDRRNLPRPGVAVGEARRALQRRQTGHGWHGEGDHPSEGGGVGQARATMKSCGRRPKSSKS
jgi:hypothetical protein